MHISKKDDWKRITDSALIEEAERLKAKVVEALAELTAFGNTHQLSIHTEFPALTSNYGEALPFAFSPRPKASEAGTDWESSSETYGYDTETAGLWTTSVGG